MLSAWFLGFSPCVFVFRGREHKCCRVHVSPREPEGAAAVVGVRAPGPAAPAVPTETPAPPAPTAHHPRPSPGAGAPSAGTNQLQHLRRLWKKKDVVRVLINKIHWEKRCQLFGIMEMGSWAKRFSVCHPAHDGWAGNRQIHPQCLTAFYLRILIILYQCQVSQGLVIFPLRKLFLARFVAQIGRIFMSLCPNVDGAKECWHLFSKLNLSQSVPDPRLCFLKTYGFCKLKHCNRNSSKISWQKWSFTINLC